MSRRSRFQFGGSTPDPVQGSAISALSPSDVLSLNYEALQDSLRAAQGEPHFWHGAYGGRFANGGSVQFADEGNDDNNGHEPSGLPELQSVPFGNDNVSGTVTDLPFADETGDGGLPVNAAPTSGQLPASPNWQNSPYMALIQMGLGTLAASGQRDARGLPMSPLGAIGAGGMAGINTLQQQQYLNQRQQALNQQLALRNTQAQLAQARLRNLQRQMPALGPDRGMAPAPAPVVPTATVTPTRDQQAQSAEDIGEIPANAQLVQQGPYDYTKGAPDLSPGMDVPVPQAVGGYSAGSLRQDAEAWLVQGNRALPPMGRGSSPELQNYRKAIKNYGNALAASRNLSPEDVTDMQRFSIAAPRFVIGPDGRATVALGTAVRHLDTLQGLSDAWQSGDVQLINKAKAAVAREFGNAAVTNITSASAIVGSEIIKALGVAGAGTAEERAAAAQAFSAVQSPAQFRGAVNTVQNLLAGQLEGRRGQARAAQVPERIFETMIGKRPLEILTNLDKSYEQQAPAQPTAPAARPMLPTVPRNVPPGSAWSPSRKMWRSPDGTLFDAQGHQMSM